MCDYTTEENLACVFKVLWLTVLKEQIWTWPGTRLTLSFLWVMAVSRAISLSGSLEMSSMEALIVSPGYRLNRDCRRAILACNCIISSSCRFSIIS